MTSANIETFADHLVGNLYFNLDDVPFLAAQLPPEKLRYVTGGPAAQVYSEMCRLLKTGELSAGSLEAGLAQQRFDFDWISKVQSRVVAEKPKTLQEYADRILNQYRLVKLQQHSQEAIVAAREPEATATQVTGELLLKLTEADSSVRGVEHATAIMTRVRANFERVRNGGTWGASTGFKSLDRIFRLVDGELIVVAARPSQGKTSLARQMFFKRALQLETDGQKGQVVFFSADDTADKFMQDLAATVAGLDANLFKTGVYTESGELVKATKDQWGQLEHAMMLIESLPIYVDDTPRPTIDDMYYKTAMLSAKSPVVLVGMDYAGLISTPSARSERESADLAFGGMKGIGNALRCPVVVLSQLKKAVEDREDKFPTPSDLLFGGENEGNVILTMVRPEHYISRGEHIKVLNEAWLSNTILVNVGKNKGGDIGLVPLHFNKYTTTFSTWGLRKTDLNDFDY